MNGSSAPGSVDVAVAVGRTAGSVEHYFHFLLGFLVPLVIECEYWMSTSQIGRVFVRSCAIFDKLLLELAFPTLTILPKELHSELFENSTLTSARVSVTRRTLIAYDRPEFYDRSVFNRTRDLLIQRLARSIDAQRQTLVPISKSSPHIIFINRDEPDPFYGAGRAEIPTAGAQRRSIANFHDAYLALIDRFGAVLATTLEGKSLAYQIALFQLADIVICQHGAALANMIWSKPGTTVIEIVPRHSRFRKENKRFRTFQELARCLSLRYRRLKQPSAHGPIDVAKLVDHVAAAARPLNRAARRSSLR